MRSLRFDELNQSISINVVYKFAYKG